MKLAAPRLAVREAAARWARRRQGDDTPPLRLHARRIYILPTRAGAGFAVMLLGMLFGGLNFANSLALLLCFVLGSLCAVAMFQCHRRLLDLELQSIEVGPAHAGDAIELRLRIRPRGGDPRDVRARVAGPGAHRGAWRHFGPADAADAAAVSIEAAPAARGPWTVPRLRLEQRAPFGLFQAWVWLHPTTRALVWPRPAGTLALPSSHGAQSGDQLSRAGLDEWAGLRYFRAGDSPRQVAWKAYARGAPLLVREYHDPIGSDRRLEFAALAGLDTEARLGQLARWVLDADTRGEHWSLHLPDAELPLAGGAAHRRASLDALALHGHQSAGTAR
jgi:uncharacterized protein (DUF58 family)